ncbi:MAG: hypothetical protein VX764_03385 [Planctomycetota bacterium]|nr:hypothetical protein [Planctomycetota bacterium]
MIELLVFLVLTALIAVVHVSVTRIGERKHPVKQEALRYFLSVAGGILVLGLIIQGLSMAFQ